MTGEERRGEEEKFDHLFVSVVSCGTYLNCEDRVRRSGGGGGGWQNARLYASRYYTGMYRQNCLEDSVSPELSWAPRRMHG